TEDELQAMRRASRSQKPNPFFTTSSRWAGEGWKVVESLPSAVPSNDAEVPLLFRIRISSKGADDVMALNPAASQMVVISHPDLPAGAVPFVPAEVSIRPYAGSPVAALPMRVNVDGRPGVVTLHQNQVVPSVLIPMAANVYDVTGTADTTPIPCTFNSSTGHF